MKEDCGCCDGVEAVTPLTECNPPGLSAIAYRVGSFATFYETMLARLSNLAIDVPSAGGSGTDRLYPLKALSARDTDDPSIALLDAWAVICDVLSFYEERIANEGYLPTALERRSILELAKLVGYRMRPGVAASVTLAFTASTGFDGTIPAGTRVQSIPGAGELPQFFETSDDFAARDVWNAMKARLTRPQWITPPTVQPTDGTFVVPAPTDANVLDTLYFDGLTTNLKIGDALILVAEGQPLLRKIQAVDAQADFKRTEVTLVPYIEPTLDPLGNAVAMLKAISAKAVLFPGNTVAQDVAGIIDNFFANVIGTVPSDTGGGAGTTMKKGSASPRDASVTGAYARAALAQIRERQSIAEARDFTRLSAYIQHAQAALAVTATFTPEEIKEAFSGNDLDASASAVGYASTAKASALANLVELSKPLSAAPSLQPRDPTALKRSIEGSFAPQSDISARLVKAFRKNLGADTLYGAWSNLSLAGDLTEVLAPRAKASLFANRDPGKVTIPGSGGGTPSYTNQPNVNIAFAPYTDSDYLEQPGRVMLDAVYDQIAVGSIIAIDRPVVEQSGTSYAATGARSITYHKVVANDSGTQGLDDGFSASVSQLTLDPPWMYELNNAGTSGQEQLSWALQSQDVLRGTIVYAQSEALTMTEEPLDTDVSGDTISLDAVYDGLEAGRWVIVSGNRTDVTNVSDVAQNELAMIAGVLQGAEAPDCALFGSTTVPFTSVAYVTAPNNKGERLVVGQVANLDDLRAFLGTLATPSVPGQQYCDQVELAPGYYANALVPTPGERLGDFIDFAGVLMDPNYPTPTPYKNGHIPIGATPSDVPEGTPYYAWRISAATLHTILKLASPLAYNYDAASVAVLGNVVKATHGQTTGEVLGDGDASQPFQRFALRQSPLTYVSAPTASGALSTLQVMVNEITWHEKDDLTEEGPRDRTFVTSMDDSNKLTVIFGDGKHGARVPTGTANVKAVYRYGIGAAGNVDAGQISQLVSRPLGAQGVINPLPATGGADRDTAEMGRRNAPMAVMALDRLVSVKDYADFSRTYAGIAKANAARLSDGVKQVVHVTIAGQGDIPIDVNSDLFNNLLQSLLSYGDPYQPVQVAVRRVRLLVISVNVVIGPDYQWEDVEPRIRAAMLDRFSFDNRDLGQSAFLSEAVRVVQDIEGVSYCDPQIFDSVGEDVTAEELASLAGTLTLHHAVVALPAQRDPTATDPTQRILAAELVFLTPEIPNMLILTNIGN